MSYASTNDGADWTTQEHYESKTVTDEDLRKLGATLREGLQQTITNILKVNLGLCGQWMGQDCWVPFR